MVISDQESKIEGIMNKAKFCGSVGKHEGVFAVGHDIACALCIHFSPTHTHTP